MSIEDRNAELGAEDLERISAGTIKRGPLSERDKDNIRYMIRVEKSQCHSLEYFLSFTVGSDEANEYVKSVWDQV